MARAYPPMGPISSLAYILKQMQLEPQGAWMVGNQYEQLSLRKPTIQARQSFWAHKWRLAIRRSLVAHHNEHRTDLRGCGDADTDAAKFTLLSLKDDDRFLLEQILAGGLATNERKARWTSSPQPPCALCGQVDSAPHRWWCCPHWQHFRVHVIPFDPDWPACFQHCGIPTFGMNFNNEHLPQVHIMMLNIQKSLNALEREGLEAIPEVRPAKRLCVSVAGNSVGADTSSSFSSCAPLGRCQIPVPVVDVPASRGVLDSNASGSGGVPGRAVAEPCDSVLDAHGVGTDRPLKGHLRNERVRRPRKNGTDAADLPKPIDLPPNVILSTRTVAGFGARYVMKCCTCGSVGQVSNRTRFVGVHKRCSRKKVRIKLSDAERLHLHKQFQGPLSSWKRERAKRMLVSVT